MWLGILFGKKKVLSRDLTIQAKSEKVLIRNIHGTIDDLTTETSVLGTQDLFNCQIELFITESYKKIQALISSTFLITVPDALVSPPGWISPMSFTTLGSSRYYPTNAVTGASHQHLCHFRQLNPFLRSSSCWRNSMPDSTTTLSTSGY